MAASAAAAAAKQREMQDFVRGLFRGSPDLSILTHAIVRKKYLVHVGKESLSKEEKEQLKLLVEEELLQMKADDSPGDGELMTETQTSVQSGGHKRPHCTSSSSDDEVKGKQEQKKQRTGKKLEIGSDEEDSGIDSKKVPLHGSQKHAGKFSSSSEQGDSGAEGHTDGSGSDGQNAKGRRKERQKGSQPTRWQRERLGSTSEAATQGQKSAPEETGDRKEATKGQRTVSENDSEEELNDCKIQKKKGFDKEQKWNDDQGRGKSRKMDKQRRKADSESEEESEEEKKKSGGSKAKDRTGRRTLEAEVGSESEDESGSDSEQKSRMQGKAASRKQWRKNVSPEESGSDSGSKRQPRKGGMKKAQRRNVSRKELKGKQEEKKQGKPKPKTSVSSEESETEPDEHKGLKQKKKGMHNASSSEEESQSGAEEAEKGESKSRKVTLSSGKSKNGTEECKGGNQRKKRVLKKKSQDASGSESSQEEEILEKRGTEMFQRKGVSKMESETDSEDSGDELVGREKRQSWQKTETEKPKRRSSKEESGNESVKREACSSSEDEDNSSSSKQPHQGKGKEHNSGKSEEHPSIRRLKRYIRECGVHRNYKKLLAGCRSRKAQVEALKQELENLGLKGRPRRRNVWSLYSKPQEQPSSPEEPPVRRPATDWSRLRGVISSDGESD
ncbi:HIRA-interacting protein 3 isoform X2 [Elgaria multicarinata webbii]|uniref:HIRA-interacting protein 3 isoform X2 n=1 Tax=Elgaria multicarinata webbii TaxID=159646 RepID=UPI002FCCF1AD